MESFLYALGAGCITFITAWLITLLTCNQEED
jgi:hypothetical protein